MKMLFAILFAWSLFGTDASKKQEKAPEPASDPKAMQAAIDKAAQAAADKALSAAAEKIAKGEAAKKAEKDRAEKLREEARADAEKLRLEARADAEKLRLEARADAEKARTEAKTDRDADRKQIETRVFKLNHASAEEVAKNLNTMWNGDFGINWKITKMAVAFPEPNSVMVTAPRLIIEACEKAIQELDIEAKQVYIEARFVELGNSASHKVGIDWSMLGGMTGTATLGGGIQSYNLGKGVNEYTRTVTTKSDGTTSYKISGNSSDSAGNIYGDGDGSITYFNGTLNFSQMALTLKCLDATEDAKTFSNPKIIVSSGKQATVDMTTKYPNVKISAKRTEGASASTSLDIAANMEAIPGEDKFMFAKEAFFSWGISLEVTPRISTNGLINVSIVPTISTQEGWVETGTGSSDDQGTVSSKYPIIKVQRLISEFNLASGTTAVIGGLSVTEEKQVDTGIPILRSIPWIGPRFFGSMERVKEQKEIIVFVTVGLVDPRAVSPDAGLPKNAILGRQYTQGQKLEPGDRPQKNMEGYNSLDMRPLEEQERDPLKQQKYEGQSLIHSFFKKDPDYKK